MAVCVGRLIHLWSKDQNQIEVTLGKSGGHKGVIRHCRFDKTGNTLVTCGDDSRIAIWNIPKRKNERFLDGHKGTVYCALACADGQHILSSADDGKLIVWDRASGKILSSDLRHESPVRFFALQPHKETRVISGQTSGHITAWDKDTMTSVDVTYPEADWQEKELVHHLQALTAIDEAKAQSLSSQNHSGSILHIAVSHDSLLMATTSTDKTCKIWSIVSYLKDKYDVDTLRMEADISDAKDYRISILDDLDIATDFSELYTGSKTLPSGYHADLMWTLQHELIVVDAVFTAKSDMIMTSSTDCTCKIWSVRKGNLLFQINIPDSLRELHTSADDDFLLGVCENRLLTFSIKAGKEKELGDEWKHQIDRYSLADPSDAAFDELTKGINQRIGSSKSNKSQNAQDTQDDQAAQLFSMNEMRQLMARGTLQPSSLDSLLTGAQDVDAKQLSLNMQEYDVKAGMIVRAIVQNDFLPAHILEAFSGKEFVNNCPDVTITDLYSRLKAGEPVRDLLLKAGLKIMSPEAIAKTTMKLEAEDFRPFRSFENEKSDQQHSKTVEYPMTQLDSSDSDEERKKSPGGRVLHFIPAEDKTRIKMIDGKSRIMRLRKLYPDSMSSWPSSFHNPTAHGSTLDPHNNPHIILPGDGELDNAENGQDEKHAGAAARILLHSSRFNEAGLPGKTTRRPISHHGQYQRDEGTRMWNAAGKTSIHLDLGPRPQGRVFKRASKTRRSDQTFGDLASTFGFPTVPAAKKAAGQIYNGHTPFGDTHYSTSAKDADMIIRNFRSNRRPMGYKLLDDFDYRTIAKIGQHREPSPRRTRRQRTFVPNNKAGLGRIPMRFGALDVHFDRLGSDRPVRGTLKHGHIYTRPLIMNYSSHGDLSTALLLGRHLSIPELEQRPVFRN